MDEYRSQWNRQQKILKGLLSQKVPPLETLSIFLVQHGLLHSQKIDEKLPWSLEDQILDDLTDDQFRMIPTKSDQSIAWIIWHIARIEDVTMNMLVRGGPQILHQDDWIPKLKVNFRHTGNAMSREGIRDLSKKVDLQALRSYRLMVGRRTREVVGDLSLETLSWGVDASRLSAVVEEGAVLEEAHAVIDYWGKRTLAGLLLMPATRHNLIHLNEAERIKTKF